MIWHAYVEPFVAGMFLANGVPHFVQGISGNRFQSPFGKPPGVGESSPVSNVLWGFGNLLAGLILLCFARPGDIDGWVLMGLGVLLMAVMSARQFGKVRNGTP